MSLIMGAGSLEISAVLFNQILCLICDVSYFFVFLYIFIYIYIYIYIHISMDSIYLHPFPLKANSMIGTL